MKTKNFISFLALSSSILFFSAGVSAQAKIAHINLDSLLRSMPESDSARKVGQAHYAMLEKNYGRYAKRIPAKGPGISIKRSNHD